jgi:hypothetical protein
MALELTVKSSPEGGAYLAEGSAGLTSKLSRLPTNAGSDSNACSWLVKLNRVFQLLPWQDRVKQALPFLDDKARNASISPSTLLEKIPQGVEDRMNIGCVLPPMPKIRYHEDTRNGGQQHHLGP